jgi:formiminoglutamase
VTDDPQGPRASAWLQGETFAGVRDRLHIVGIPMRRGSISGGRFDLAPAAIREVLARFSTFDAESGSDVRRLEVHDQGDIPVSDLPPERAMAPVFKGMKGHLRASAIVLLGGDNSITRPAVLAFSVGRSFLHSALEGGGDFVEVDGPSEEFVAEAVLVPEEEPSEDDESERLAHAEDLARIGLLTLDAHHDLRDTDPGLTNGNPIRALLEDGLPGANVAQIGIQPFANSADYSAVAVEAGIHVVTAEQVRAAGIKVVMREALAKLEQVSDAIYVDLDVDVLDRAFAPASPGSRPGGLTPMEVQQAMRLCGAHPKVRAMDVVEVDPERDVADVTVMAAASFVLHFASGLARRGS